MSVEHDEQCESFFVEDARAFTACRCADREMRHVVMMSGGIGSWAVARRVLDEFRREAVTLLFADVKAEHADLYRFLADACANLRKPLTVVSDGRTPQQVMRDRKFLGNSQIAPCSHLLKQEPCRRWLVENTTPERTVIYVGIDWTEVHRLPSIEKSWAPYGTVRAPLTEPPYVDKRGLVLECRAAGLVEPALYAMGFPHNNCGGACVRGGQAQWAQVYRVFPDLFASWETFEQEMRAEHGDVAILRDRTGGEVKPLPLTMLRSRVEAQDAAQCALPIDGDDWGGCGCFTETEE